MMPLALLMARFGGGRARVSGSDRAFDRDPVDERRAALERGGVTIHPQQGGHAAGAIAIVSTAIESSNPDLAGVVEVRHRSEVLRDLIADAAAEGRPKVLVGGSSGKTTTTAMTAWILQACGRDPLTYVGGAVAGLAPYGARWGSGPIVVEMDESDGSIERFTPDVAVVTSVSEDHKPLAEIEALLRRFIAKGSSVVIAKQAAYLSGAREGSPFVVASAHEAAMSRIPGAFNRINEALAVEAAVRVGVSRDAASRALADFPGVGRRLEIVMDRDDRRVIDDFAHNPEKIAASIAAVKEWGRPVMAIYQPHGYGPLRMQKDALGRLFSTALDGRDAVILLPVYDAGGTADRSIRSEDLLALIAGPQAAAAGRAEAIDRAAHFLREPGTVVVMGARDPSLATFARMIVRG